MNHTWRRTPEIWAFQESRAHYAKMASKGWMLQKRGTKWDRFIRCAPKKLQFWLELTRNNPGGGFFDDPDRIPEEKLALYEECGWKLVAENGGVHIFAAPAGEEIPQPYDIDDPQQDEMVRGLQKFYRSSLIGLLIASPLCLIIAVALMFAPLHKALGGWWWIVFWALVLLESVWNSCYGVIQLRRLRKQLQQGQWPGAKSHHGFKAVRHLLRALSLFALVLGLGLVLVSWRHQQQPLPEQTTLYPMPSEVFEVERTPDEETFLAGMASVKRVNQVSVTYAWPFFKVYEMREAIDEDRMNVYQDVYVLQFEGMAPAIARALMADGTFAAAESYVPVDIPGLDAAWYVPGGMEYVAYRENFVVYGTIAGNIGAGDENLLAMLEATALVWN